MSCTVVCFFFFNDTATTEIYTLSLHDALPILFRSQGTAGPGRYGDDSWLWLASRTATALYDDELTLVLLDRHVRLDRKSTRLNSSHANISYAVFCLKKKKNNTHR